jgi:hypothetical protein
MSRTRGALLAWALADIWIDGTRRAKGEGRELTADEYFRQVDGLGYKEVLALADPTGEKRRQRNAALYAVARANQPRPARNFEAAGQPSVTHDINSYQGVMWNTPEGVSAREGR